MVINFNMLILIMILLLSGYVALLHQKIISKINSIEERLSYNEIDVHVLENTVKRTETLTKHVDKRCTNLRNRINRIVLFNALKDELE